MTGDHGRGRTEIGLRTRRTGPRCLLPVYTRLRTPDLHECVAVWFPCFQHDANAPDWPITWYTGVYVRVGPPRATAAASTRSSRIPPYVDLKTCLLPVFNKSRFDFVNTAYAFQFPTSTPAWCIHYGVQGETPGINRKQQKRFDSRTLSGKIRYRFEKRNTSIANGRSRVESKRHRSVSKLSFFREKSGNFCIAEKPGWFLSEYQCLYLWLFLLFRLSVLYDILFFLTLINQCKMRLYFLIIIFRSRFDSLHWTIRR